jgi:hypothetical protein
MTLPAQKSGDFYHYSENGTPRGPFTTQELKDLAAVGKILPQTFIWKNGSSTWVPARSVCGLLPSQGTPVRSQPYPATILERPRVRSRKRPSLLVAGVFLATILVLVSLVVVIVLVAKQTPVSPQRKPALQVKAPVPKPDLSPKAEPKASPAQKTPPPPKKAETPLPPPKKEEVAPQKPKTPEKPDPPKKADPPPPPPVEFAVAELLTRYQEDPGQLLKEVEGKPVTLKMEGTWNVDSLQKAIHDGVLRLRYSRNEADKANPKPHETIRLVFPLVDPNAKLGFFAKIEEYAKQRKKGERVVMTLTGILTTTLRKNQKFLVLDKAVLK